MINKMSPSSGRMLKENGQYVNIADLLESIAEGIAGGTKVILMKNYNIEPNEEAVIEFQDVKNLRIKNIGAGVVYINFDNNIADTSGFPLVTGASLTEISCNKLRLFSQYSSEVEILGGA